MKFGHYLDQEWKSKGCLHHINLYFDLILRSSDKLENGENIFC